MHLSKIYNITVILATVLLLFSCNQKNKIEALVCNKDTIASPKLTTIAEFKQKVREDTDIILEVSPSAEYQSGHIPNAQHVWRPDFSSKTFINYNGMRCNAQEFQQFLQNRGVVETSQVYLYDNKGGCDAMRLAWVFDYFGFENYQVINGGKSSWIRSGAELDTAEYRVEASDYIFPPIINTSVLADLLDVQNALLDTNTVLIDTREYYEYEGRPFIKDDKVWHYKKGAFERGSIPGSIHINWSEMSDLADDHRIKCIKDLEYNFKTRGVTKDKKIIVYCQSGSRSSHTAFVLREILGYPNVKNYDGSWIEWTYHYKKDNSVPIKQIISEKQFAVMLGELKHKLNN